MNLLHLDDLFLKVETPNKNEVRFQNLVLIRANRMMFSMTIIKKMMLLMKCKYRDTGGTSNDAKPFQPQSLCDF